MNCGHLSVKTIDASFRVDVIRQDSQLHIASFCATCLVDRKYYGTVLSVREFYCIIIWFVGISSHASDNFMFQRYGNPVVRL